METAVNRDYSGEILLRVSPESGRFIVTPIVELHRFFFQYAIILSTYKGL